MLYSNPSSASVPSVQSASSASQSSRELLFGEIDTNTTQSLRSNVSYCNLTLSTNATFLKFWLCDTTRNNFLSCVDGEGLANLRLVGHDFSNRVAPFLFKSAGTTFKASTFAKPARLAALERIGHYVETFSFNLPHSTDTFLPPLICPTTGEERTFVYTPQIQQQGPVTAKTQEPKYGSWEIADLLVKQYPPLFHAATNVPAFIRAFSSLPNLQHLKVNCPGQEVFQSHRRSVVDYALISLRIAVETAPLYFLDTLSFNPIHPAGFLYLQPMLGIGASPKSTKRWNQISTISICMDGNATGTRHQLDHLKILHKYLRNFSSSLSNLTFRWLGEKGPCPLSLDTEPCFQKHPLSRSNSRSDHPDAIQFSKLHFMELENATMDASQISAFINRQRRTLNEFKFESIALRTGDWDEALAPLAKMGRSNTRRPKQAEVMDVPLILRIDGVNDTPVRGSKPGRRSATVTRWLSKARSVFSSR